MTKNTASCFTISICTPKTRYSTKSGISSQKRQPVRETLDSKPVVCMFSSPTCNSICIFKSFIHALFFEFSSQRTAKVGPLPASTGATSAMETSSRLAFFQRLEQRGYRRGSTNSNCKHFAKKKHSANRE